MILKKEDLLNFLDADFLQTLQDAFAGFTGTPLVFVKGGQMSATLPKKSSGMGFCRFTGEKKNCPGFCEETLENLCRQSEVTGKPIFYTCPIWCYRTAVIPVFYKNTYVGSWVMGPVKQDGRYDANIRQAAQAYGFTKEQYEELPEALQTMDQAAFADVVSLIGVISTALIGNAAVNKKMAVKNSRLIGTIMEMLMRFSNLSSIGLYVADYNTGELLFINDRIVNRLQLGRTALLGMKCWQMLAPEQEGFCAHCPRNRILTEEGAPGDSCSNEIYVSRIDMWIEYTVQAFYWIDGRLAVMVACIDNTNYRHLQESLDRYSHIDRTLGLPNSLQLAQDLEKYSGRNAFYLIFLDINSLRKINDMYGRRVGDLLLEGISGWIREKAYPGTVLYRIGGDEFCLAVEDGVLDTAKRIARDIQGRFEDVWQVSRQEKTYRIFCSVTIGIADGMQVYEEGENYLNLMDRTLAAAKAKGTIIFYDDGIDNNFKEQLKMEQDLRDCIHRNMEGFSLRYQPIVEPITGRWDSLEVLCRWDRPGYGPVSPEIFIHEAEQLGLISILGKWILETAIRQCKAWQLDRLDSFLLDVNLSPMQLLDEDLDKMIVEILDRWDYPNEKLSLEMTESAAINFNDHTLKAIERLVQANVKVALDDFGTGYSSFNNLKNMPVSILKTEKVFIDNLEKDAYLQHLLHLLVELAHTADMKIIVEGVETEKQMEILLKNGADYMQGYLFSKPLPAEEMGGLLHNFYSMDQSGSKAYANVDVNRIISGEGAYYLTPELYRTLNYCIQALLYDDSLEKAVKGVLERIGRDLKVSRVQIYIMEETGKLPAADSGIFSWDFHSPEDVSPEECLYVENVSLWLQMLRARGSMVTADVSLLSHEAIGGYLAARGAKAMAVLPFYENGEINGFMSIEERRYNREWTTEEILILNNLCSVIASIVKRHRLQGALSAQKDVLATLLNSLDIVIFTSDIETYEVLFANRKAKGVFGAHNFKAGVKCYEALFHYDRRCDHCVVPRLAAGEPSDQCKEAYNEVSNRYYQIFNTLIPSGDNKTVHLSYFVDITTLRAFQRQLEVLDSDEAYPNAYSKKAITAILLELLRDSYLLNTSFVLCYMDFDRMRYINETWSTDQGSLAMTKCVTEIKRHLGENDLIGHYISDEFIVILPGCTVEEAHSKMAALQQISGAMTHKSGKLNFTYGLADTGELSYSPEEDHGLQLIKIAKARMFEGKELKRASRK